MKKIRLIIIAMMFLIFVNSVYGVDLINGLRYYYKFDNATTLGTKTIDSLNKYNGTIRGATTGVSGKMGQSYWYDGTNDYAESSSTYSHASDRSYCAWIYLNETSTEIIGQKVGIVEALTHGVTDLGGTANRFSCNYYDTAWRVATDTDNTNLITWYYVCCVFDINSKVYIYVDGTQKANANIASAAYTKNISFGYVNGNYFKGKIDEFGFWNRTLNTTEISFLYNIPSTIIINVNITYPPTDTQFNTLSLDINFTYLVNNTNNIVNCSLYQNGILNDTIINASNSTTNTFSINYGATTEQQFNYTVNCSNNETSGTDAISIYIDNADPAITSEFTNFTVKYKENLTGSFNFTDGFYLHSYNITVDGNEIDSNYSLSGTFYQYNLSYNVSSLSPGNHILGVRVADGHTSNEIDDYDVKTGIFSNYLKYEFKDGGFVHIREKSEAFFDNWDSERQKNKYTFEYKPENIKQAYNFIVTSDKKIRIVNYPESEYKTWLITGDKWIDFYNKAEKNAEIKINRINDYSIEVIISNLKYPDLQIYSSIGDLNIVTQYYNFTTTNTTLIYSSAISELEYNNITFIINTTDINSTQANLTWNGTTQTFNKTSFADFDSYTAYFITPQITGTNLTVNFTITYNISGNVDYENGTITEQQLIYVIGVDNCSTYTTTAINITFYNESNNAIVNATLAGYFEVWIASINNFREFNISWAENEWAAICIEPSYATYYAFTQFEYFGDGFGTKTYYFFNTTLDNSTENLSLYLTPGTTAVTFSVVDENDNEIEDVYIYVLSYDLPTNSYTTTEILKTGYTGEAIGNIILNTQWYKFILTYNGDIVLETTPVKITGTSYTFRISLEDDYFTNYNIINGVSCLISFNNATKNFAFVFNDPSGNVVEGCLDIQLFAVTGKTTANSSCVSSSSSTILLNIGNDTSVQNKTYVAKGIITLSDGGSFVCDTESITFDDLYQLFGTSGILMSFLLILTLTLIGIWNPIIAVVFLLFGLIVTNVLGIFHLNWEWLVAFIIIGGITLYRLKSR